MLVGLARPMPVCLPMQIASPVHEVRVSGAFMKMMMLNDDEALSYDEMCERRFILNFLRGVCFSLFVMF